MLVLCIYPKNYLVVVVVLVVLVVMMNDSVVVDMYVNVYVGIYVFTQARVISILYPYPYPFLSLPTYLPTKPSSIDHRFLIFPPVPLARARARVCVYMN